MAMVFYAGNLHMRAKKHVAGHVQRMTEGNLACRINLRCNYSPVLSFYGCSSLWLNALCYYIAKY